MFITLKNYKNAYACKYNQVNNNVYFLKTNKYGIIRHKKLYLFLIYNTRF